MYDIDIEREFNLELEDEQEAERQVSRESDWTGTEDYDAAIAKGLR